MNEKQQVTLGISGMTCASCAARIEKIVNKMDGVHATVNIALEQVTIQYDPMQVTILQVKETIEKLGFHVKERKEIFRISGMTCASCSARIEKVLHKMQGVISATVNLAMNTGTITYIDGYVVTQDIIDKIQKLGFQVTIYQEKQEKENDSIQKRKQLQLFCSILLSLPFIYMMIAHTPFRTYIDVPSILMNPWVQLLLVTP